MRVLLVGAGTVGEAIAKVAADRDWLEYMLVTDYDTDRANQVVESIEHGGEYEAHHIDASSAARVAHVVKDHGIDLVMNAVDPQFVMAVFDGAFAGGANYMDMAMSLSRAHPDKPYEAPGVRLVDAQFEKAGAW